MKPALPVVALLALFAVQGFAQDVPEPPALELPLGARVRLRTVASPDHWVQGLLAGADTGTIAVVPEEASPLGDNRLRIPSDGVTRLEVFTGKKRQWLLGLLIGAGVGVVMGFDEHVDPVECQVDGYTFCNRGTAVAAMGATSALLGAVVGNLVKTDVWTPVALDALGPPPPRRARTGLGLRAVPGGLSAQLSVSF